MVALGKFAKDVLNQEQTSVRRRMRVKAAEEGAAPKMKASERELMMMVVQMHLACKAKAEKQGRVIKTFREAGLFAYERGENGLQVAQGERWEGLPLMCSKHPAEIVQERLNWRTAREGLGR